MQRYKPSDRLCLYRADCLVQLARLPECSVDAIVTDPPYEIGFVGRSWDKSGIAHNVEVWRQCLRLLKPGGYLLAFSSARTYHRMACAIEDAEFEIRDQIMWLYGSGMPRSFYVSKKIDTLMGVTQKVIGKRKLTGNARIVGTVGVLKSEFPSPEKRKMRDFLDVTVPTSPEAQQWSGWGTGLKPAHEPIVVARKSLNDKVAQNVLDYGTGAMNLGACLIPKDTPELQKVKANKTPQKKLIGVSSDDIGPDILTDVQDRWPANVIHDGSPDVISTFAYSSEPIQSENDVLINRSTAAKFFYCAKAPNKERGNELRHPTVKPLTLMRYLCKLVTQPRGLVLDPFMGSGSTGIAALSEGFRFTGIELSQEYFELAKKRIDSRKRTLLDR